MKIIDFENIKFINKKVELYYLILLEEMTCMNDLMNTKQLHAEWIDEESRIFSISSTDFGRITCNVVVNGPKDKVAIKVQERGMSNE